MKDELSRNGLVLVQRIFKDQFVASSWVKPLRWRTGAYDTLSLAGMQGGN